MCCLLSLSTSETEITANPSFLSENSRRSKIQKMENMLQSVVGWICPCRIKHQLWGIWTGRDGGIFGGPGTKPLWIPRDGYKITHTKRWLYFVLTRMENNCNSYTLWVKMQKWYGHFGKNVTGLLNYFYWNFHWDKHKFTYSGNKL